MAELLAALGLKFSEAATIAISTFALVLSWRTAGRSGRLSQSQLDTVTRQGDADARIAAMQAEAAQEQTRLQRDSDIIQWAATVIGLLAEMAELPVTEMEDDQRSRRWHQMRHRLSTQIDIGRFYFPNYASDFYETDNPAAFRGRRQRVLEYLIESYDIFDERDVLGDLTTRRACKQALVAERRKFISEVQRHIDPSRYVEFLDKDAIQKLKKEVEDGASGQDVAAKPPR